MVFVPSRLSRNFMEFCLVISSPHGCACEITAASRVWTPSWTGWTTGTSPRSDVIVNLYVMPRHRVRNAMPTCPNQSGKISPYFHVLCSCARWLLGPFFPLFFKVPLRKTVRWFIWTIQGKISISISQDNEINQSRRDVAPLSF
ncbi:uncharacterized protein [Montipora capricornis]|uniref:uncharacterized protein n=1 Tax=Montipora capricornis TaxID=246305 RepID=UPI0035F16E89